MADEPEGRADPRPVPHDDVVELRDPRALRALAHPLRMQIWEALSGDAPKTATQLAEELGESSASMSYHLRQMARYGFLEEAPEGATGRERPWRKRHRRIRWSHTSEDGSPAYEVAARELSHVIMERYQSRLWRHLRHETSLPREWRDAAQIGDNAIHVTPEELRAITAEIYDLLRRYQRHDPAERPAGARKVVYMLFGLPELLPDEAAAEGDPAGEDPAGGADA